MSTLFGKNDNMFSTNNKESVVERKPDASDTQKSYSTSDIPSFSDISYADGRKPNTFEKVDRTKTKLADIVDTPVIITGIHERKSKMFGGGTYTTIEYEKPGDDTKYFANTSGIAIRKQIEDRNIQYPFKATVVKKNTDNGVGFYYKLS